MNESTALTTRPNNPFLLATASGEARPAFRYMPGYPFELRFSGKTGQILFDDGTPLTSPSQSLTIHPMAGWVTRGVFFEDSKETDRAELFFVSDGSHPSLKEGMLCCLSFTGLAATNLGRVCAQQAYYLERELPQLTLTITAERKEYSGTTRGVYYVARFEAREAGLEAATHLIEAERLVKPVRLASLTPEAIQAATYLSGTGLKAFAEHIAPPE